MYNVEAIFRWTKLLIFHSYQKTFLGLFQKQHTHSVIEKPLCSNLQKVHYFHKSIDNEIVEMYFDKNLMGFVVADD